MSVTPGLNTAKVIRNAMPRGTHAGVLTAMGCATRLFAHAGGVAVGFSALLLQSAAVFETVRRVRAHLLMVFGVPGREVCRVSVGGLVRGAASVRHLQDIAAAPVIKRLATAADLQQPSAARLPGA